jgi:hypothetical protein
MSRPYVTPPLTETESMGARTHHPGRASVVHMDSRIDVQLWMSRVHTCDAWCPYLNEHSIWLVG